VAYPNIDPVLVADVTGNGNLSGLDAQRIALEAVGLGADEIPDLPQPLRLADSGGRVRSAHQQLRDDSGAQSTPSELTDAQLAPLVEAAVARIESVDPATAARLEDVRFQIVDLPENLLGLTVGHTIRIDVNAAGYGWFIEKDEVQRTEDEVGSVTNEAILAVPHSVDLLTVVFHELGHVLGYDHEDEGIMEDTLPLGMRRLWDDTELPLYEKFPSFGQRNQLNGSSVDAVFGAQTIYRA
jgi:hypothetical protein